MAMEVYLKSFLLKYPDIGLILCKKIGMLAVAQSMTVNSNRNEHL
jgi:hypothetical protein